MDNYTEQIVAAKPSARYVLISIGAILITVMGVAGIMWVDFSIGILLIAVGGFLIYLSNAAKKIEFEYIFTNGDCDIARITNKSKRKDVLSFAVGDVQRILPYSSDKARNEFEVNDRLEVRDFGSGNKENSDSWYVFFFSEKNTTKAAILELNEKNIEHVKCFYKTKLEK